jgi:molecular chaperone GrpE (heat shock protein)
MLPSSKLPISEVHSQQLRSLLEQHDIPSWRALSQKAQVTPWQVRQVRCGQAHRLRADALIRLAGVLQQPVEEFYNQFSPPSPDAAPSSPAKPPTSDLAVLREEYQRLQAQLSQQQEQQWHEFQRTTLTQLESWLVQWPTVAYAVQHNPALPASRLLPLVKPLEQLLKHWQVEAIAPVGSEVSYDPHYHQLMDGHAEIGDRTIVRYTGYIWRSNLLYRCKVAPVKPT